MTAGGKVQIIADMSEKKKPEKNYAAELWKDKKKSVKPKPHRQINANDEKKTGQLLTDAKRKKTGE